MALADSPARAGALVLDENGEPTWRYDAAYFRAVIAEAGLALEELARLLGVSKSYPSRMLGYRRASSKQANGRTYTYDNSTVSYDMACRIAKALALDPVDVGV